MGGAKWGPFASNRDWEQGDRTRSPLLWKNNNGGWEVEGEARAATDEMHFGEDE